MLQSPKASKKKKIKKKAFLCTQKRLKRRKENKGSIFIRLKAPKKKKVTYFA